MKKILLWLLLCPFLALASEPESAPGFRENKGQWEQPVLFRADQPGMSWFARKDGFTFDFFDQAALSASLGHHFSPGRIKEAPEEIRHHALKTIFLGSQTKSVEGSLPNPGYYNYYLGSRSAAEVRQFQHLKYKDIYPGTDLDLYYKEGIYKYDFVLKPGASPEKIKIQYEGHEKIELVFGTLVITTSLGEITEQRPLAWQELNGRKVKIPCEFKLEENRVSFQFPEGYNARLPLVIDPVLIFASYSGSTADNFGMTATYDEFGNLYAGGIAFNNGYPTTTGAYDVTFTGPAGAGITDVVISKYNSAGTAFLYSTYLGGAGTETVHSMVVNEQDELMIYGVTGSNNFPTTAGAFDATFNGGTPVNFANNGTNFTQGTDIYVARFNSTGTTLLASTYVGGSANDGMNYNSGNSQLVDSLHFNYGDVFRGEIIADSLGNCYITSSTRSADFPLANPYQATFQGQQDAIVFKMDPALSALSFSTFLGGSNKDAGYSLKLDNLYNVYVTGGTASTNFPVTVGTLNTSYLGGKTDGYIVRLSPTGNVLLAGTFIGTTNYDQSFFIETDRFDNVYVVGQTLGNYPITPGVYSNPNSGQFITKLDPLLTTITYSTRFGNGNGQINISPSAFLVDYCENVYVSGWGANILQPVGLTNMPLTPNAFQSSTDGFNFYLIVFDRNLVSLNYATYFGGAQSHEHVDGGTSRFDKNGIIYQSVCAGCGGFDDFPTTPGVVSTVNNSFNCNNGVFKFDFQILPTASFNMSDTSGCIPFTIQFTHTGDTTSPFQWDFGNNDTTSVQVNPIRTFTDTGTYYIYLTITDTICNLVDTAVQVIHVYPGFSMFTSADTTLCDSGNVTLSAGTNSVGNTFHWSTSNTFTDTLNQNGDSIITINALDQYYYVMAGNPGCTEVDSVRVIVAPVDVIGPNVVSLCMNDTATIHVTPADTNQTYTYNWFPSPPVIGGNGTASAQVSTLQQDTVFLITTNQYGCQETDTFIINVSNISLALSVTADTILCQPDQLTLTASTNGASGSYHWSTNPLFSDTLNSQPGDSSIIYFIDSSQVFYISSSVIGCEQTDSVLVGYFPVSGSLDGLVLCSGETGTLEAEIVNTGGTLSYLWQPAGQVQGSGPIVSVTPTATTNFIVTATNAEGCYYTDTALVMVNGTGQSQVTASQDTIPTGGSTVLSVSPAGSGYLWTPASGLNDPTSGAPIATPGETTTYLVSYVDQFGCVLSDSITVYVFEYVCSEPYIFLPNAFTPNDDGDNDIFRLRGNFIRNMDLKIFDRWGELVFESTDPNIGWDGTYKGRPADPAVFVYHLKVSCLIGEDDFFKKGNVTLIR